MDRVPDRACDSPVQTHLHWHNENACLMVLIISGLVVPMSVLTQLLTATLWKAFCFLNEIPVLMLPVVNSGLQTQNSPYWWQKQKLHLCLFSFFSFIYFFTHHHANTGILPLSSTALCLWLPGGNTPASLRSSNSHSLLRCALCHILLACGNQDGAFRPVQLKREIGDVDGKGSNCQTYNLSWPPTSGSYHW